MSGGGFTYRGKPAHTYKGHTLQIGPARVTILKGSRVVDYAGNLDQALHVVDTLTGRKPVGPCPCECNRGQHCGGCGHAGCGRR